MRDYIKEYLKDYFNTENPNFAVLIKGKWGCGKTYFIKEIIQEYESTIIQEDETDTIKISKPIYVSLFGHKSINGITNEIKKQISPFLYSKKAKLLKEILRSSLKATIRFNIDYDKDGENDGVVSYDIDFLDILLKENKKIKGKKIIFFDDLERSSLESEQLFGFINQFIEHSTCRVILIANEDWLKDKKENEAYLKIKEKIIGQTFSLEAQPDTLIKETLNSLSIDKYVDALSLQYIEDIFNISKKENLRVLKSSLINIDRFIKNIDIKYRNHDKFVSFFNAITCYFLIISLETNTGNLDIDTFQDFMPFNNEEDYTFKEYKDYINRKRIPHSNQILSLNIIQNFILNGGINVEELNNEIGNNIFFKKENELKPWEVVTYWHQSDDKLFEDSLSSLVQKIERGQIDNYEELLYINDAIFRAIDVGLHNQKKDYYLKKSISIARNMLIKDLNKTSKSKINSIWSFGFPFNRIAELGKLADELKTMRKEAVYALNIKKLEEYWENLDDLKIRDVDTYILKLLDREIRYDSINLLHCTPSKLSTKIIELSNTGLNDFLAFINDRYNRQALSEMDKHKKDINILVSLRGHLQKDKPNGKIKSILIQSIIIKINELENIWKNRP